ncbi:uncharacterized protein LOC127852275 [Dreissena polymorpha]|uniref:Protein sleepless n=1 Tax=Dreissena polymorpha TaxID=45954 RepID=A0A9D4CUK9_DREPO|nr:uncharacterized protein LOC127852275 [Dreissena polymorpha]KAH3730553.1 hypothetical protein DPMN_056543 [Dreissena polymorpha]
MATNFLLSFALVIYLCAGYSAAIKCYECNGTDVSCADTFDKGKHKLADGCAQCLKVKAVDNKVNAANRKCLAAIVGESKCQKGYLGVDVTACFCNTDGCNGASSVYFTMATIIAPLLMLTKHVI